MTFHWKSQKQGHVPAVVRPITLKKEERQQSKEAEHCCPQEERVLIRQHVQRKVMECQEKHLSHFQRSGSDGV